MSDEFIPNTYKNRYYLQAMFRFINTILFKAVLVIITCITILFSCSDNFDDEKQSVLEKESTAQNSVPQALLAKKSAALLNRQLNEAQDKRIPKNIRDSAKCIIIFPSVIKAGVFISGKTGKGLASCRQKDNNKWGAPLYVIISAGGTGLKAGIEDASIILILLDQKSVDNLIHPDIKLGTKLEISPGPIGAMIELEENISVLSYIKSKGLFLGIDLDQPKISDHRWQNNVIYGEDTSINDILFNQKVIPERFDELMIALSMF